ncbi:hypothetical protein RQP46_006017 [Phenoliferia psychrophenolica]
MTRLDLYTFARTAVHLALATRLRNLGRAKALRCLSLQVTALNPIFSDLSYGAATLSIASLALEDGTASLGTYSLHILRACKTSLRRCRLNGTARWAQLLLEELAGPVVRPDNGATEAGYHLRGLVVFADEDMNLPPYHYTTSSHDILESLSRIFKHQPLKTLAIGKLANLEGLGKSPCPTFWTQLPPSLEELALASKLEANPTNVLELLRSGRCPRLRHFQVDESRSRAVGIVAAEHGVTVDVDGDHSKPVWTL